MTIVSCANCGKKVEITKANAYEQLKAHKENCKATEVKLECPNCHDVVHVSVNSNVVGLVLKHLKTCKGYANQKGK
jgi:endogenous inhibitor of DNA gyrase (YacG/DUF329 family)